MDTLNPPNAIHGKAIDLASEGDRVWFEQNPDRLLRLRDMTPFENNGPMELPPHGMTWQVIVLQIKRGMRYRLLLALPEDPANEDADDERHAQQRDRIEGQAQHLHHEERDAQRRRNRDGRARVRL